MLLRTKRDKGIFQRQKRVYIWTRKTCVKTLYNLYKDSGRCVIILSILNSFCIKNTTLAFINRYVFGKLIYMFGAITYVFRYVYACVLQTLHECIGRLLHVLFFVFTHVYINVSEL